jgi:hypothetical protein
VAHVLRHLFHLAVSLHFTDIVSFLLNNQPEVFAMVEYESLSNHPDLPRESEGERKSVQMINLVTMCPCETLMLAPFHRIVTHRGQWLEASIGTLGAIAEKLPDRNVLDRTAMMYGSADVPYTWLVLNELGYGPRESYVVSEESLEGLTAAERKYYRHILFWLACTRDAS